MRRYFSRRGGVLEGACNVDGGDWKVGKENARPKGVKTQRGAALIVILMALMSAPAWGKSFTGELILAEGARTISDLVNGQVDHFESFTFILDSNGMEYDLIEYEGKLPHRSTRGTLVGDMVDQSTIAVESFVEEQMARAAQEAAVASAGTQTWPLSRSILAIKVNLVGEWQQQPLPDPPTVYTLADNPLTEEFIRYHFWERPWNLQQYFDVVTRNQFTLVNSLDGDSVPDFAEVTLTPDSDPCGNGQFQNVSSCSQIRTAVKCALSGDVYDPANYFTRVYIGPDSWGCGFGLGTVGSGTSSSVFSALASTAATGLQTPIHELGHNLGLQHSNQLNGSGVTVEYADYSCIMGASTGGDPFWRKGYNAVQLFRLGLMDGARNEVVANVDTNYSGALYSTYFQESGGAVTKLVQLGDSNYFLSYRSPVDQTVDQQANQSLYSEGIIPINVGRLLVHYLEPVAFDGINKNQVTLHGSMAVGETAIFGGYTISTSWQNDDMIYLRIGPSPAAAPAPPPTDSAGIIVARSDTQLPLDARTSDSNATCEQTNTGSFASCSSFTLDILDSGGLDQDIFARLKINVQQGSVINSATLKLQQAGTANGNEEYTGGTGSITMQVQVEDIDDAPYISQGMNLRARSFVHTESRTFSVPLHWSDEVSLDITRLIQAMVDRPGWVSGNYVLLNLRRSAGTAGTDTVAFSSARLNQIRGYFTSPRVIIDTGCKFVTVSGVDESSNQTYEACDSLTLGPSFTVSNDAEVFISSGLEINFMPGFTINQGAILDAAVCGQSLCSTSLEPMPEVCHSCVEKICKTPEGAECCNTAFNQSCVDQVKSVCGLNCQ